MLTPPPEETPSIQRDSIVHLKAALVKYYALLYYTGIKHGILASLLPIRPPAPSLQDSPPSHPHSSLLAQSTLSILFSLPSSLIRLILFMPPLYLHLPGYITGHLAAKLFAVPREEESYAQFKAIGGGIGIGANLAVILGILWKTTWLGRLVSLVLPDSDYEGLPLLKRVIGLVGTAYCSVIVLAKWHKLLVKCECLSSASVFLLTCFLAPVASTKSKLQTVSTFFWSQALCIVPFIHEKKADLHLPRLQRLLTYHKLLSMFIRKDDSLSIAKLAAYTTPPLPAANVFIKRREGASLNASVAHDSNSPDMAGSYQSPKLVSSRKLIRHLLDARTDAYDALSAHLTMVDNKTLSDFLLEKGGTVKLLLAHTPHNP